MDQGAKVFDMRAGQSTQFQQGLLEFFKSVSFLQGENRRKDGGIYALSFHQAEANGIHDGGCWSGGRRCRCRQDARHWLQGRFGTFIFDSLSFCLLAGRQKLPAKTLPAPLGGGEVKIFQHLPETNTQRSHFTFNGIIG